MWTLTVANSHNLNPNQNLTKTLTCWCWMVPQYYHGTMVPFFSQHQYHGVHGTFSYHPHANARYQLCHGWCLNTYSAKDSDLLATLYYSHRKKVVRKCCQWQYWIHIHKTQTSRKTVEFLQKHTQIWLSRLSA